MSTPVFDSSGLARLAIREMIRDYGAGVLDDEARISSLLPDLLADAPREATLLRAAARLQVGTLLKERHGHGISINFAVENIGDRLAEQSVLDLRACRWVVSEYATALGYALEVSLPVPPPNPAPPPGPSVPPQPSVPVVSWPDRVASPPPGIVSPTEPTHLDTARGTTPDRTGVPGGSTAPSVTPRRSVWLGTTGRYMPIWLTAAAFLLAELIPSWRGSRLGSLIFQWLLYCGPLTVALVVSGFAAGRDHRRSLAWYALLPLALVTAVPFAEVFHYGYGYGDDSYLFSGATVDQSAVLFAIACGVLLHGWLRSQRLVTRVSPAILLLTAALFVIFELLPVPVAVRRSLGSFDPGAISLAEAVLPLCVPVVAAVVATVLTRRAGRPA